MVRWAARTIFSIIDPIMTFCKSFLVLHCNYNREIGQKFNLVVTFDRAVLLTQGQRVWTAFCKIFPGTPHLTIFGALIYAAKYAEYAQICQICCLGRIFGGLLVDSEHALLLCVKVINSTSSLTRSPAGRNCWLSKWLLSNCSQEVQILRRCSLISRSVW